MGSASAPRVSRSESDRLAPISVRAQRVPEGLRTPRARAETPSVRRRGVTISVVRSPEPGPSMVSRLDDWAAAGATHSVAVQAKTRRDTSRDSMGHQRDLGARFGGEIWTTGAWVGRRGGGDVASFIESSNDLGVLSGVRAFTARWARPGTGAVCVLNHDLNSSPML